MASSKVALLLASTVLAAGWASSAMAANGVSSRHSFGGSIKSTLSSSSNIGAAASNPSGGAPSDDDEDFSLDEELDDVDAIEEALEEADLDQEDLDEDDGFAGALADPNLEDDAEDEDGDGDPDVDNDGSARKIPALFKQKAGRSKTDGDSGLLTQFGLNHGYVFNEDQKHTWKSSAKAMLNAQNDRSDMDRTSWAFSTGPEFNIKSWGLKLSPSITYMDLNVDSNAQMQSTVAALAANYKVNKNFGLSARYSHEMRNNQKPKATNLDVDGIKLGATYVYGKNLFKAAYSFKVEDNETNLKDKDANGFELGYGRKLPWKWQADAAFKYGISDYTDLNPNRTDDGYQYGLKFTKKLEQGFFFDFGGVNKLKDSNIGGKNSRSSTAFVSAGYKF